jgi:hypothetical protein
MTTTNALFAAFKARALSSSTTLISGPTWGSTTLGDLDSETLVKCTLTDDTDVNLDEATHQDWADVSAASVPTSVVMTGTAITQPSGATIAFDAADVTFTSVTGDQAEQVLIWFDTAGANTTDILICKFGTATGLPVTPNGGNIIVQWNASGIFTW